MKTVNIQNVCNEFVRSTQDLKNYIEKCKQVFSEDKKYLSNCYEYAAIDLYKNFEHFILRVLIACLNHDHSHIEELYGIQLGKHINYDVCEFLVTKGGFFDFKGRSGLIQLLGDTIGKDHEVVAKVKNTNYTKALNRLYTIRNYAAHNSKQSKIKARDAFGLTQIGSAGSCLKAQERLDEMIDSLVDLANEIKTIHL